MVDEVKIMKTVVIDTNIILRYLLGEKESENIEKIFNSKNRLFIPDIVVAEVVWTLQRYYKWEKNKIVELFVSIFSNGNVEFNQAQIFSTFETYLKYNVKYADAYIYQLMSQKKLKYIYSYDREFDRLEEIQRIEPK